MTISMSSFKVKGQTIVKLFIGCTVLHVHRHNVLFQVIIFQFIVRCSCVKVNIPLMSTNLLSSNLVPNLLILKVSMRDVVCVVMCLLFGDADVSQCMGLMHLYKIKVDKKKRERNVGSVHWYIHERT